MQYGVEAEQAVRTMVDIHAHLLPGVDDGACTNADAVEMLASAYRQGVRTVFCTSHSYGEQEAYWKSMDSLRLALEKAGVEIKLCCGNEIQWDCGQQKKTAEALETGVYKTLNGTDWVLVEFYTDEPEAEILRAVRQLQGKTGCRIVLAHVERYEALWGNWEAIAQLREQGCLFQVNAYDLNQVGKEKIRSMAQELLAREYVSFLGSDAHRLDHRPPEVEDGLKYVYAHCSREYADSVAFRNAQELLGA